jgi:hypothetical protein
MKMTKTKKNYRRFSKKTRKRGGGPIWDKFIEKIRKLFARKSKHLDINIENATDTELIAEIKRLEKHAGLSSGDKNLLIKYKAEIEERVREQKKRERANNPLHQSSRGHESGNPKFSVKELIANSEQRRIKEEEEQRIKEEEQRIKEERIKKQNAKPGMKAVNRKKKTNSSSLDPLNPLLKYPSS